MAVQRWTFDDGVEQVTLPINPKDGGSPEFTKKVAELGTTAPDGIPILFEGSRPAMKEEFSGVLHTQEHYELLWEWWDKSRAVTITDDLDREIVVYFESFQPRRVRSALYPWKHEFSVRALVLQYTHPGS